MNPFDFGALKCTRARAFPLPYFITAVDRFWSAPPGSARIRHRIRMMRTINIVANRCVFTLNRMYSRQAAAPPSEGRNAASVFHSDSLSSSSPARQQASISHHSTLTEPPSEATRQQARLLLHIRSCSASFVRSVRSSSADASAKQTIDRDPVAPDDMFSSFSFDDPTVGRTHGQPDLFLSRVLTSSNKSTGSQRHARTRMHFPTPRDSGEGPLPPVASVDAPTHMHARYATHSAAATAVVPLVASRIALPTQLHIVPVTSVLPSAIAQAYSDPAQSCRRLRPLSEVAELDSTHPLKPARVAGSRHEYVQLIKRMRQQGMTGVTSTPKCVNGVFAVAKDADADRVIVDAQPANRLFIDSPHVALPNPSHLAQLRVPKGARMSTGKSDFSNYYHQLGLPTWMVDYFALPPLSAVEWRSIGVDCSSDVPQYPVCLTVPMGWSHAVYLANTAHEHVVYSSGALRREDNLLHLADPTLSAHAVVHGIIIDDMFMHSLDQRLACDAFARVLDAYRAAGFVVKPSKVVWPSPSPIKVLGFMIERGLDSHTRIALAPQASADLARTTLHLLARGFATGLQLSHVLGRWTWCMLLRRPSLAVLQHCYRFIEVSGRRRFTIWPSVRRELWSLLGLLVLLHSRLDVHLYPHLLASDASETAAGEATVATQLAGKTRAGADEHQRSGQAGGRDAGSATGHHGTYNSGASVAAAAVRRLVCGFAQLVLVHYHFFGLAW